MSDFKIQGKLLQKLYEEGALSLYHDYRSRSFLDWSGNANTGTPTDTIWNGGSVRLHASTSVIAVADSAEIQLTEGCLVMLANFSTFDAATEKRLFSKRDGGGVNYELTGNSVGLTLYDGTNYRYSYFTTNGNRCLAVNFGDGTIGEAFADGISAADFNLASAISVDDAPLQIASASVSAVSFLDSPVEVAIIINRKLTETEHSQIYGELEEMQFPTITDLVSNAHLLVDPYESGLAAGWNMFPVDGEIIDVSHNGNDGTISGPVHELTPLGDAMRFDGVDVISVPSGIDPVDFTVSFWFKHSSDSDSVDWIWNKFLSISDAWGLRVTTTPSIEIYDDIDNAGASRYITNTKYDVWMHIAAVLATSGENLLYINGELVGSGESSSGNLSSFSAQISIGARTTSAGSSCNGNFSLMKLFDEVKDQTWVTKEYQRGLAEGWHTDWGVNESVAAVTGGNLENSPFAVESGSFKISMDTVDGEDVKVIECVSAGVVYIPTAFFQQTHTEAAYGEWEFWFNKNNNSVLYVLFIASVIGGETASGQNGYNFTVDTAERVYLRESTAGSGAGLFNTDADYVVASTWYRVRITRTPAGVFTIFLNDVLVVATVGTNPITDITTIESNYIALDLDAGDKVAFSDRHGGHSISKKLLV